MRAEVGWGWRAPAPPWTPRSLAPPPLTRPGYGLQWPLPSLDGSATAPRLWGDGRRPPAAGQLYLEEEAHLEFSPRPTQESQACPRPPPQGLGPPAAGGGAGGGLSSASGHLEEPPKCVKPGELGDLAAVAPGHSVGFVFPQPTDFLPPACELPARGAPIAPLDLRLFSYRPVGVSVPEESPLGHVSPGPCPQGEEHGGSCSVLTVNLDVRLGPQDPDSAGGQRLTGHSPASPHLLQVAAACAPPLALPIT